MRPRQGNQVPRLVSDGAGTSASSLCSYPLSYTASTKAGSEGNITKEKSLWERPRPLISKLLAVLCCNSFRVIIRPSGKPAPAPQQLGCTVLPGKVQRLA